MKEKYSGHKKKLCEQFIRQTTSKASKDRWRWLRKEWSKRAIEAFLMVTQEQVIRTNNIKTKTDKTQENSKCRTCGKPEESVNHVLSDCSMLAQKEYKRQHD